MTSTIHSRLLVRALYDAGASLTRAHAHADGTANGPVRDLIFGLNTALEALISMIQEAES